LRRGIYARAVELQGLFTELIAKYISSVKEMTKGSICNWEALVADAMMMMMMMMKLSYPVLCGAVGLSYTGLRRASQGMGAQTTSRHHRAKSTELRGSHFSAGPKKKDVFEVSTSIERRFDQEKKKRQFF
jgi:predicted DNA repair protein MutK